MEKVEVGEVFTIVDENDEEHEVEVLASLTLDGTEYMAVGFVEDIQQISEEDFDIFFMKVDSDGDLSAIESDEEFDKVSAAFEESLDEEE
ncbi:DUF1292 domain-containing protein [Bacillus sp. FJAT-50079]|uniref:DUF1292 domain-containing protein n=1 Tax=Bacillus sp. FJAT-50079 TaxID=2833577 RepID=UPI001BC8D886|nr:DUF1292 domain-containing protein [Bacillus sp. FJAT-50079]MBS4209970.1 DUF1292 domain-containing protein [Bacillus sp. FJAT-50079]